MSTTGFHLQNSSVLLLKTINAGFAGAHAEEFTEGNVHMRSLLHRAIITWLRTLAYLLFQTCIPVPGRGALPSFLGSLEG